MGMKRFVAPKYFVYLGQGNIQLLHQLDEAVQEVQNTVSNLHLKSEDWNICNSQLALSPGDVFSLDGELLYKVSYWGEIEKVDSSPSFPWSVVSLELQFESWNMWQSNRLENELAKILDDEFTTENWGGAYEPPAVITFVRTREHKIGDLVEAVQKASPYIRLGFVGILSGYFVFPVRLAS
jgi:hypothetical protein